MSDAPVTAPAAGGRSVPDELHPRHLLVRVAEITAIVVIVVIAISALPGLGEVRARLEGVQPIWIVAIALAEVGSCAGYLLVFRETFCARMAWGLSYDIAMAELAANALLPAGGAGGLALGVWALRQAGMPTDHIARRTVAFFVVTSAANFFALVLVGLGVFVGILAGRESALLTLVPALITAVGIVVIAVSPKLLRGLGKRGEGPGHGRWRARARDMLRSGLAAGADGVEQAIILLRSHSLGVIVGSFAYMAFDIAGLGFGFAAVGSVPAFGTLVLGYLIGQLGNLIPVPGGIGATEGALVAVFALYGVKVADATAAVLLYRLFQLLVPAALGAPAFILLRRRLMRSDQPALVCGPLALDVVKLPTPR
ncbi:MAG TPA: YbhN family protein [Polyangia bacterium]|nr:YbhN family protein [Polyangia bacterium]